MSSETSSGAASATRSMAPERRLADIGPLPDVLADVTAAREPAPLKDAHRLGETAVLAEISCDER